MPEENKTEKTSEYILLGNKYSDEDTKEAVKILDEIEFPYRYAHCDSLNGPMPQLVSGLGSWAGLGQISRCAKEYKRRCCVEKNKNKHTNKNA